MRKSYINMFLRNKPSIMMIFSVDYCFFKIICVHVANHLSVSALNYDIKTCFKHEMQTETNKSMLRKYCNICSKVTSNKFPRNSIPSKYIRQTEAKLKCGDLSPSLSSCEMSFGVLRGHGKWKCEKI